VSVLFFSLFVFDTKFVKNRISFLQSVAFRFAGLKSPQQRIKELEQKLRLLEHQNNFLSEQLIETEDKAAIPDKLIDLAEAEYLLPVRKNSLPDQSVKPAKKKGGQL
jgi:hypothetical protein